jgi:hypothetical protein
MLSLKLQHFPWDVFAAAPPITCAARASLNATKVVSKPVKGRSTPAQL